MKKAAFEEHLGPKDEDIDESRKVSVGQLIRYARDFMEPGEEHLNREYTRALIEILVDAAGLSMDDKPIVARRLGIPENKIQIVCK